jgi:hypothetical protein
VAKGREPVDDLGAGVDAAQAEEETRAGGRSHRRPEENAASSEKEAGEAQSQEASAREVHTQITTQIDWSTIRQFNIPD